MSNNLESIIVGTEDIYVAPIMPRGVKYASRFTHLPVKMILEVIGFNNYREHSLKETNNLSNSIKKKGLLEPITIAYDTKMNTWDFIDGEGRFWACYQNGADEVPVDIFYDVPEDTRLRMKIAANSTKTKIASEDIAALTAKLQEQLLQHAVLYDSLDNITTEKSTIKPLSEIICRHPDTVRKYLMFNNLHEAVMSYVNEHRNQNFFSRSIKIGSLLEDKNAQLEFLTKILEKEEERRLLEEKRRDDLKKEGKTYAPKSPRLKDHEFRIELKGFAASKQEYGEFRLENGKDTHKVGHSMIMDLSKLTLSTKRYVDAFRFLAEAYSEIFSADGAKESLQEHVYELKKRYESLKNTLPEGMYEKILHRKTRSELTFREKMRELSDRKRDRLDSADDGINRVRAIGDEILFINMEDILPPGDQLRKEYNPQSIDALAKELADYGQLKPGLLIEVMVDGKKKYRILYGHTRYLAAKKIGLEVYKAFVRSDIDDLEKSVLQAVEDLSESDSPIERAKVINKHYNLQKLKHQLTYDKLPQEQKILRGYISYSKEDFIKDFSHLGSAKTLRDALEFMELDENLRGMAGAKLIGYESAIKIGKLSEEHRLSLLYTTMATHIKSADLDKKIAEIESNKRQIKIFDDIEIPKNYDKVLSLLKHQSLAPFNHISHIMSTTNETVLSKIRNSHDTFENYIMLHDSIVALEKTLENI